MMFLRIIWAALSGNLGKIVGVVTGYLGKLSDNETARYQTTVGASKEVTVTELQTAATVYHDRVDLLKGMRVTQVLIFFALAPPLYHQAMVFLDSCPLLLGFTADFPWFWFVDHRVGSWNVPPAPGVYGEREGTLIGSLLGIQGGMTLGASFLRYLHK